MADQTKLSEKVTVKRYREWGTEKTKSEIASFVEKRFAERYIRPIEAAPPKQKHGFCSMAVSCLMVEALESFWRGWTDTKGKSELAFCSFFQRIPELSLFAGFVPSFYKSVRCGILHQAETTDGWKVVRRGPLFE